MCIAAFALIIAASNVIYAIVRCSDPSIAERQESGLLPTRADIAAEKRRRCKVPVAFAIVFLIVAVIAFVFYGFTRNTSSSDDPTSGATGGQATIVEKDDSNPKTVPAEILAKRNPPQSRQRRLRRRTEQLKPRPWPTQKVLCLRP